jgi:hypothetical protein
MFVVDHINKHDGADGDRVYLCDVVVLEVVRENAALCTMCVNVCVRECMRLCICVCCLLLFFKWSGGMTPCVLSMYMCVFMYLYLSGVVVL